MNKFIAILISLFVFLVTVPAGATSLDFNFHQSGFEEGAFITGSFSGRDINTDGQLTSFSGEISNFSMTFSGNSLVDAFTLDSPIIFALIYDLFDGQLLGDRNGEGIVAGGPTFRYESGVGPSSTVGGRVAVFGGGRISSTQLGVVVANPIPEPTTMILFGIGLLSLTGVSRRKN